jgi:hypothetical protein
VGDTVISPRRSQFSTAQVDGGDREKRHSDVIARERVAFRSSTLLASEAIGRRNVAAVEPDRLQTSCRGGGARARLPDNQTGLDYGTGQPRRRAILIGTRRWAYHVVLQRNTGHPDLTGNPPYSFPSYSRSRASSPRSVRAGARRQSPGRGSGALTGVLRKPSGSSSFLAVAERFI